MMMAVVKGASLGLSLRSNRAKTPQNAVTLAGGLELSDFRGVHGQEHFVVAPNRGVQSLRRVFRKDDQVEVGISCLRVVDRPADLADLRLNIRGPADNRHWILNHCDEKSFIPGADTACATHDILRSSAFMCCGT